MDNYNMLNAFGLGSNINLNSTLKTLIGTVSGIWDGWNSLCHYFKFESNNCLKKMILSEVL